MRLLRNLLGGCHSRMLLAGIQSPDGSPAPHVSNLSGGRVTTSVFLALSAPTWPVLAKDWRNDSIVMPERFCRASRLIEPLDSRQKHAGMTPVVVPTRSVLVELDQAA